MKKGLTCVFLLLVFIVCSFSIYDVSAEDALTIIHKRKSVREYLNKPVTKEQLTVLMKAAMAAPTAMDKRPWAFVVITQKEMLAKLSEGMPYSKMIVPAGAAIVVCGDVTKALPGQAQEFWIQDCSAASENILLAAEAIGLGAVWTGVYPSDERVLFVRQALGLPENIIPLNIIAIGNPVGAEKPKDKFDPGNIHWEKW